MATAAPKRAVPRVLLAILGLASTFVGSPPWAARSVLCRAGAVQAVPESKKSLELLAGKFYNGKVVKVTKYGAQLDLGVDRPGFLHVAQCQDKFIEDMNDILKLDDEIQVRIRRHKGNEVEVSMRDSEEFQKRAPYEFSTGEEVEGTLLKVWDQGQSLVDVGGLVAAVLPRKSLKDDPANLEKGQKLKVRVASTTGCTMDVEQESLMQEFGVPGAHVVESAHPYEAKGFRWTKEVSIKGASALVVHFYEKSCTYDTCQAISRAGWIAPPVFASSLVVCHAMRQGQVREWNFTPADG
eukprot:Skav203486  [mRNA]  locus=scaffold3956:29694:33083:+ [translate_table: standard]